MSNTLFSLAGKNGLILGIANDNSIAFGCARLMRALGAQVVATCLNEKARKFVEPHTAPLDIELLECDVEQEGQLQAGDGIYLLARPHPEWPLARVIALLYERELDPAVLRAFAQLALPPSWQRIVQRRLDSGQVEDWSARVQGG